MKPAAAAAALLVAAGGAQAGLAGLCERPAELDAAGQDRLLRIAALLRRELDAAGAGVALVARSGTDLRRLGIRYSHAGLTLKANPAGPWAVRQLYYACDERRPRLFDQGLAGFLLGSDDPRRGFVSLLALPGAAGRAVEAAALATPRAAALLAGTYSANAHAWSTAYQNCNQWLAELLADAWGFAGAPAPGRAAAQAWLRDAGYAPTAVPLDSHAIVFAAHLAPLTSVRDHPLEDLQALTMRVSLPGSLADFALRQVPGARRIELCHDGGRVVIRRDAPPLDERCQGAPGDEVVELDG